MSIASLAATMPRRTVLLSDGAHLSLIDVGEGRPIVILPAWTNSAAEYARLIQELSSSHRVIAVDMRGHGQSDRTEHGYRIGRFTADLRAVLSALELDDVTLVGHSLGCAVIWSYFDILVRIISLPWCSPISRRPSFDSRIGRLRNRRPMAATRRQRIFSPSATTLQDPTAKR
jgi:alpha-beta hydrolase superfamily lysophospholipase